MATKLQKYVIEDRRHVPPFNEPASELSIMGKRLKLHQADLLQEYFGDQLEARVGLPIQALQEVPRGSGPCVVYRDSVYFDKEYFHAFYTQARHLAEQTGRGGRPMPPTTGSSTTYVKPLTRSFEPPWGRMASRCVTWPTCGTSRMATPTKSSR
jgi:hypothetical protein